MSMSHRRERVASVIREVISDAITNRLSDPRISRFTSVTRVHVSSDLEYADVAVSVMGDEREARLTMQGLASARGAVQGLLAKRLDMRRCPLVRFELDVGIKKGFEIIRELDRLEAERRLRDERPGADASVAEEEAGQPERNEA